MVSWYVYSIRSKFRYPTAAHELQNDYRIDENLCSQIRSAPGWYFLFALHPKAIYVAHSSEK